MQLVQQHRDLHLLGLVAKVECREDARRVGTARARSAQRRPAQRRRLAQRGRRRAARLPRDGGRRSEEAAHTPLVSG
eukprot:4380989-Prymnesium_polylepis.1